MSAVKALLFSVFPQSERLTRESFPAALAAGRRISSEHFSAVVPEKGNGYAVVVSKKVARLSVTRHRVKRQVLGILRTTPALPPALILFPKSTVARLDALHVRADLDRLLAKVPDHERNRRK